MIGILTPSFELRPVLSEPNPYIPLANNYKVDLCFYTTKHISIDKLQTKGHIYSYRNKTLSRKTVPIPKINLYHNTAYVRGKNSIKKVSHLRSQENTQFFNLAYNNQRNKLSNYEYLLSFEQIKDHLPETAQLSYDTLTSFLENYDKVIIKPKLGSRGRRITIIRKKNDTYQVYRTHKRKIQENNKPAKVIALDKLQHFYNRYFKQPKYYLIQQWIEFLKYKARPFDIRIAVQKNKKNKWRLSSCVARVAGEKGIITNLHQGGETLPFRKLKLPGVKKKIAMLSREIARTFEEKYPTIADMGLDLALDKNHHIWFIEANFCSNKEKWSTQFRIPFEHVYTQYAESKDVNPD